MTTKKYILVFLLLVVGFFAFKFYNNSFGNFGKKTDVLLVISHRTTSFFYTKNIEKLNSKLDSLSYLNSLKDNLLFYKFKNELEFLDKNFIAKNKDLSYNKILFSAYNIGSSKIEYLSVFELGNKISLSKIKKVFENKISNYKYQGFKIYTTKVNNTEITFAFYNNLILFSKNSPLVEEALNTLNNEDSKTKQQSFQNLKFENINDFDIHLFIDFNATKDLEAINFNISEINKIRKPNISWSYSAINFNPKTIDSKTVYSFNNSENIIKETKAVNFSLDNFLPNNTAFFEATCSENNKAFRTNENAYKFFSKWLENEIAFFSLETFDEDYLKRSALVLKAKNIDTAKLNLYLLNKEMAPVSEIDGLAVYQMNLKAISNLFRSNMFSFEKPYFVFLDKYVVFSNEISVLRACKDKYEAKSVLAENKNFKDFLGANKANKIVYLNPQRWQMTLDTIFTKNVNLTNFGKIKNETFITDSLIYSIGKIDFEKEKIKKTTKIWEVVLDTISTFRTQIVLNADNKRKELFTQDEKNQVYLIDQSGEIIFKKKIKEKIIGNVYQIDYFKTNRLQYVFNTKNYIYVMERNGKIIDDFPLKLPAEASNSIFVVNYDKAKNYRYFIACNNEKIYAYKANGTPLREWSPLGKFGIVSNTIKHASFSNKDFLYFNTDNGTFYTFNRKGEKRFDAVNIGDKFYQAFEKYKYGFINFTKGSLYKIDIKGKTTAKILADSTFNIFTNYPEKSAYAIANKNEIRIAKSKWTILGKKRLNDEILNIEKVKIQSKIWFLVNCKNSVYLVNEKGEIHPDFPKLSNSKARVVKFYSNKNDIMILAEKNKLKAFQLVLPN